MTAARGDPPIATEIMLTTKLDSANLLLIQFFLPLPTPDLTDYWDFQDVDPPKINMGETHFHFSLFVFEI